MIGRLGPNRWSAKAGSTTGGGDAYGSSEKSGNARIDPSALVFQANVDAGFDLWPLVILTLVQHLTCVASSFQTNAKYSCAG
jgi:hypothetical protein